jgi:hypothetical protein
MNTRTTSFFKDPIVAIHLSYLHDKYSVFPGDIDTNNNGLLCVNRIT